MAPHRIRLLVVTLGTPYELQHMHNVISVITGIDDQ